LLSQISTPRPGLAQRAGVAECNTLFENWREKNAADLKVYGAMGMTTFSFVGWIALQRFSAVSLVFCFIPICTIIR